MTTTNINWKAKNILKINSQVAICTDETIEEKVALKHRKEVEPWLSAVFQSEHFSLLIGSGLTNALTFNAGVAPQQMGRMNIDHEYKQKIIDHANKTAKAMDRGDANIEDDIRSINELLAGLEVLGDEKVEDLKIKLNTTLQVFIQNVLTTERDFYKKLINEEDSLNYIKALESLNLLKSFLLSFSSRAASRERLNLFTTNYDRFIELGADEAGILLLDRFKGKMIPIFRNTRLELDFHYNPPGIRGEPRYVEGVARITKLHGSIDWRFENKRITRALLPFGAPNNHPQIPENISDRVVIYPNSSKDIETAFYPYAELFRDFSSAICRPNSVLFIYGYGFGDSHINRVIEDMLTIPSTHLAVVAYDKCDQQGAFGGVRERIKRFYDKVGNPSQFTLMIGDHFGNLSDLVHYYLPKSAIDRLTIRKANLVKDRGEHTTIPSSPDPTTATDSFDV